MSTAAGLFAHLTGNAGVALLIGTRLFPDALPQGGQLPAATYRLVTALPEVSHSGPSGVSRDRYQIDGWAETAAARDALGRAIVAALSGHRGPFGSIAVQAVLPAGGFNGYEPGTGLYRASRDFIIWHGDDAP